MEIKGRAAAVAPAGHVHVKLLLGDWRGVARQKTVKSLPCQLEGPSGNFFTKKRFCGEGNTSIICSHAVRAQYVVKCFCGGK